METCCLCKASVSSVQEKKRRKRLYGDSCQGVRGVLTVALEGEYSLHLEDFVDTEGKNSYLCRSCDTNLRTVHELQSKVSYLMADVKKCLAKFKPSQSPCLSPGPVTIAGRKRSLPSPSTSSPSKQARLHDPSMPISPTVSVKIGYPSGTQVFAIHTPSRKEGIKQYTRRSFKSLATNVISSPALSDKVFREIARVVKSEMNELAGTEHDSILRDHIEAVKYFSWETVYLELEKKVPTLIRLLRLLVKTPSSSKPFIACLASQLVKDGHPKLGLMQRAMSIFLYGNGASKDVYTSLNHLNICMSYSGMLKTLKKLCIDHDMDAQNWSDSLKLCLEKDQEAETSTPSPQATTLLMCSNTEMTPSPPAYSPVSDWEEAVRESTISLSRLFYAYLRR